MASTSREINQASTKLSEEAKQKLLELQTQLQEQQSNSQNSNYIKFKKGYDCKVLRFEAERTRTDNVLYPNNTKPSLQYKFYASELLDKKENRCTKVRE
ncbi:MAG: hypothetical protein ACJ71P_08145, partial [Nitrososphaeraceae archaeon]